MSRPTEKPEEWMRCLRGIKGSFPPPKKRVVIAVMTKYKDENGQPFVWQPYAERTEPDYMTILGQKGKPRIRLSRVMAWKKER